ncbi:hypothetical protein AWC04_08475 [Mycolicibacterium fallax]|uniref:Uncharacterized protein n=1 Tax=Mycolicibacterium fallax TaxID=1793 RepID=A0A1X1RFK4_MYCFA|nr:hypothetical protein AWC04_08475 [Mycolicibacterium fallax]
MMCGDRLTVASEAEFERFRKYVSISPAVDVEEAVTDVFRDWLESKCWQIAYVDFERVIRDSTKEAITEFLTKSRSAANPEQSP